MTNYSLHDIVTIQSDIDLYLPENLAVGPLDDPDISVEIGGISYDKRAHQNIGDSYHWNPKRTSLILDHGLNVRAKIQEMNGDCIIRATSSFKKRGNLNQLVFSVIMYRLLAESCTLVHTGAARGPSGETVMIQAWDNMGKTSTTLSLLEQHNCDFLGDDAVFIHDGEIYSFARTVSVSGGTILPEGTLSYKERLQSTIRTKLNSVAPLNLAFKFFPSPGMGISPFRIINPDRILGIGEGETVDKCVFLEPEDPSRPDVVDVPPEEAKRRSVINSYLVGTGVKGMHHHVQTYSYMDESTDDRIMRSHHSDLVRNFFDCVECYGITTEKSAYNDTISSILGWD